MTFYYPTHSPMGAANGRYRAAAQAASGNSFDPTSAAHLGTGAPCAAAPIPAPLENAGIRTGELIGYRAWILGGDGLLRSVFVADYIWRPGAVETSQRVDPIWGAGLHAFKTLRETRLQYSFHSHVQRGVVFGEVFLWGEVIEHEYGYRAQYAAIKSLISLDNRYSDFRHPRWKFWKPSEFSILCKRYPLTPAYRGDGG